MIKETWSPIKGFENLYEVSNLGRVKSLSRVTIRKNGKKLPVKEKIMKLTKSKTGYLYLTLTDRKKHLVHRLVASTFLNHDSNRPHVNHKDFNKANNCVNNLEWCTPKENTNHAIDNGKLKIKGEESYSAKLVEVDVINIFKLRSQGSTYKDIASVYNIDQSTIGKIIKRKLWSHLKVPVFFLLMLFSFNSNAQIGNDSIKAPLVFITETDTVTCYTLEESRRIANKMIAYHECDSLNKLHIIDLDLADSTIAIQDSLMSINDSIIYTQYTMLSFKEDIIKGKNKEIMELRFQAASFRRRTLGWKIGTITLGVGLAGVLIWAILK